MILRVALALALLAVPSGATAESNGSGLVIEVKDGQLVTVSGQTASLAHLVSDLCAKTGTTLRGYEAGDRPITVSYEGVPLRVVLQRMLRDETYMIGVRSGTTADGDTSDIEVSWVHVTGSKTGAASSSPVVVPPPLPVAAPASASAKVPGTMTGFGVASDVITQALGSENATERREATRQLAEHLEANPGELDAFLSNEMGTTADELATFPFANEALRTLASRQKDPRVRARIDAIAKSVDIRRNEAPKKPSYSELMQQGMPH